MIARLSANLDLWCACLDHPQRAFGGLYHCAKFGYNRYSSFDNMQVLILCELGLKTHIHAPKLRFLGKIGEGVMRCWPLTNSFLLLGLLLLCHFWRKSMKKCDRESADRQTDRQTDGHMHWQRQTDFIICPMLYAIAMGKITTTDGAKNRTVYSSLRAV